MKARSNSDRRGARRTLRPRHAVIAGLVVLAATGYLLGARQLAQKIAIPRSQESATEGANAKNPFAAIPIERVSSLLKKTMDLGAPTIELTFQGTLKGERGIVAIINDNLVTAGATFDGIRILDIQPHTLTIEHDRQVRHLIIGQNLTIAP